MKKKEIYVVTVRKLKEFLRKKEVSSGAKLVLLNLISRLGGKCYCWPSQRTIAYELGLSDRQIRYHLNVLKQNEILTVTSRRTAVTKKGYWANSNEYDLRPILHTKIVDDKTKKQKRK